MSAVSNQSCATCHNPNPLPLQVVGSFINDRVPIDILVKAGWPRNVPPPVSRGSDLTLFGGRNTPSSTYAAFSPAFRFDEVAGLYVGGKFWDGREMSLAGQAAGFFRNPVEMAMPDKKAGVAKLQAQKHDYDLFAAAYATEHGPFNLGKVDARTNQGALEAYDLIAKAIGEFEKTQLFNKFNSKYDYFLAGMETLTAEEDRGRRLFNRKAQCALRETSCQNVRMVIWILALA